MPKALPAKVVDLVRAYALQGVPPKDIAEKTGVNYNTINGLKWKHGWTNTVVRVKQELKQAVHKTIADNIAQASTNARTILSQSLLDASQGLSKVDSTKGNLKRLYAVASVAEKLVNTADKLYGWSADAEDTIVSVSVLRELAEPGALDATQVPQVLDVQSTPAPADTPAATAPAIDQPVSGN